MRAESEQLEYVRETVTRGEYRVDSQRVAEAMLERIGVRIPDREVVSEPEGGHAQMLAMTDLRAA